MKLLQLRKDIKAKKPTFTRQELHRKAKMNDGKWRRPRGLHSKMRLNQRGKKASPSPGYGSPREVEGLHPSGLRPIVVHTIQEIDGMQKHEGAVIGSKVGMKKREMLVMHAQKKGVSVLNISSEKFLADVASTMKARKETQKKSKLKAAEKKEEKKSEKKDSKEAKAAHHANAPETPVSEEEQKKKEKEEKDKLLTKKV